MINEPLRTLLATSQPPPEDIRPVVVLDRTFNSAKIAAHLQTFREWRVELHGSVFAGDCPDQVWIREFAKRGWIILSCDKEIRRSPEIQHAVKHSGAKLFYMNAKNKRAEDYMSILATARHRILRKAKQNKGPFFASIDRNANVTLVGFRPDETSRERTKRKFVPGATYRTRQLSQRGHRRNKSGA